MKKKNLKRFRRKLIKCSTCFIMECHWLILKKILNEGTWVLKWKSSWHITRKVKICSILLQHWVIWNMRPVKSTIDKIILIIKLSQERFMNDLISLRLKSVLGLTLIVKMLELWDDGGLRLWNKVNLAELKED